MASLAVFPPRASRPCRACCTSRATRRPVSAPTSAPPAPTAGPGGGGGPRRSRPSRTAAARFPAPARARQGAPAEVHEVARNELHRRRSVRGTGKLLFLEFARGGRRAPAQVQADQVHATEEGLARRAGDPSCSRDQHAMPQAAATEPRAMKAGSAGASGRRWQRREPDHLACVPGR